MDDGTILLSNDTYPLKEETFRLYYTSNDTSNYTDQQQITITLTNNYRQLYDLDITFTHDSDKEE